MTSTNLLASGICILFVGLLAIGITVDMIEQARANHSYVAPDYLVDFCRTIIATAVGVLTLGTSAKIRKRRKANEKESDSAAICSGNDVDDLPAGGGIQPAKIDPQVCPDPSPSN